MRHFIAEHFSTARAPKTKSESRASVRWVVLLLSLAGFLAVTLWFNARTHSEQQFAFLARSFLHGSLSFREIPGPSFADTSPYADQYYWPLGPLPAVILMPFELVARAFGAFFYQGYLQPLFVLAVLIIIYRIARVTGYGPEDATYLAFGFAFATAFLGVAIFPWCWYFSNVITCMLVFAAIAEMVTRRRPWLIGILFALVLATRVTAALGVFWYVAEILRARTSRQKKVASLAAVGFPIVVMVALLMLYNYARFGNPFDQGYAEQLLRPDAAAIRALGLLSLTHVPGNLYTLLLAGPSPVQAGPWTLVLTFPYVAANPWGMSLWVTSPFFVYLLWLRYPDVTSRLLLLTCFVVAAPVLLYYAVGFRQFGYRYSLDFLPFLYYLLLRNYRQQRGELTAGFKAVILGTALWNLYLFAGTFIYRVVW